MPTWSASGRRGAGAGRDRTPYKLGFTATMAESDFPRPCIIGCASGFVEGQNVAVTHLCHRRASGSPAEFGKLIADETEKWGKVIRAALIRFLENLALRCTTPNLERSPDQRYVAAARRPDEHRSRKPSDPAPRLPDADQAGTFRPSI